jgi:hypothetical protein
MKDLKVVTAKAVLTIYSVTPIRGFLPESVLVTGKELFRATEFEYNGVISPEFILGDPSRAIVQIPPSQVRQTLTSLRALAPISVANSQALLNLGLTVPMKTVEGIDRLTQSWLLIFLTTPGSDIFDKSSGAGARSLIGKPTNRTHDSVAAELSIAISQTKDQLIQLQSNTSGIPPSEKLLSSNLTGISFDANTSILTATVELVNMVGQMAALGLE